MQCLGTTTKGNRCKIKTDQQYCQYHKHQASGNKQNSQTKTANTKGSIYIYTLKKFFDNHEKDWFKVKNLPNDSKNKQKWSLFELKKSPFVFLKIGMTSQTVLARIKQWEDKCKHDIILINPRTDSVVMQPKSISRLFKCLCLSDVEIHSNPDNYSSLTDQGGFFCKTNLTKAESEIHQILRQKYGSGVIYCRGCSDAAQADGEFVNGYNIHVEWFLIPKDLLSLVYSIINTVCKKYS